MLMQPEGAAVEQDSRRAAEEEGERDIDGVPLLESEPIDFSRAGGGLSMPVDMATEGDDGTNLDGEPMEVHLSLCYMHTREYMYTPADISWLRVSFMYVYRYIYMLLLHFHTSQ